MRNVFPLLLLIAISACEGAPARDPMDLDGVSVLAIQPELRLGSVDDPGVGFSRPGAVAVDRDDNLYVFEGLDGEFRVYSPAGELIRRFGGQGDGPGEFNDVSVFGVAGDTVWVVDNWAQRITLLILEGDVLSTGRFAEVRVPLTYGWGYMVPRVRREDGLFLGELGRVAGRRGASGLAEGDFMPVPRVLFAADGSVVDTVGWDPSPRPQFIPPRGWPEPRFEFVEVGMRRYLVPDQVPAPPHRFRIADGLIMVEPPMSDPVDRGEIVVTRVSSAGDTIYQRRLTYTPTAYTSADLDSIAARAAVGVTPQMAPVGGASGQADPAATAAIRAKMQFPRSRAPIQYPWLDQDERVWMLRVDPEGAPARWVLLDIEGVPRGIIKLPPGSTVLWSRGDVFWAKELDDMDVPWIVRYRIVGS